MNAETVLEQGKTYHNYKKNFQNNKKQFLEYDFRTADHSLSGRKPKISIIVSKSNYKTEYMDILPKGVELNYDFEISNVLDCRYPKLDFYVSIREKKCIMEYRLKASEYCFNKVKEFCSKQFDTTDEYIKSTMNGYLPYFEDTIKSNQRKHFSCDRLDNDLTNLKEYVEKGLKAHIEDAINNPDFTELKDCGF